MSLQGTLGDFGIADIFQLIGHQAKTGVLVMRDKRRELDVRIFFVDGNVVKAEQSVRDRADLLGNLMVRGGALSQAQLDAALGDQKRTMRRLGDILVDGGALTRETLRDFARLQTTETIYRLFQWRTGTYQFEAQPVEYDEGSYEPIRSENVLMEGFRMIDEWPSIRRVVPSSRCTFEVLSVPPAPAAEGEEDDDLLAGMDDAFSAQPRTGPKVKAIGDAERTVFQLIKPNLTVLQLVDMSRLGEFEATKALATLASHQHIRVIAAPDEDDEFEPVPSPSERLRAASPHLTRLALFVVCAGFLFVGVRWAASSQAREDADAVVAHPTIDADAGRTERRIGEAIAVAQRLNGKYPLSLQQLVDAGLLSARDLTGPFVETFQYRVAADGAAFQLAQPLH
jgi:Domain of unknown function (DUF4388)